MNPKVIVLTLHYNQPELTIKCIESILLSEYDNYEIVVIDNNSEKKNYLNLEEYIITQKNVSIIKTPVNLGYGKGINFGLNNTYRKDPTYWVIMNNDTIIDSKAISELVKTSQKSGNRSIVSGIVYDYYNPEIIQYAGAIFKNADILKSENLYINEKDMGQFSGETEVDMLDDIMWLLPAKIYENIGGYSPTYFMYGEQNDYVLKARKAGYKMLINPLAKIWHLGEASSGAKGENPIVMYWRIKSQMIYYFRYLSFHRFIKLNLKLLAKIILKWKKKGFSSKDIDKAEILGMLSFYRWVFDRKDDYGNNPFNKRGE